MECLCLLDKLAVYAAEADAKFLRHNCPLLRITQFPGALGRSPWILKPPCTIMQLFYGRKATFKDAHRGHSGNSQWNEASGSGSQARTHGSDPLLRGMLRGLATVSDVVPTNL